MTALLAAFIGLLGSVPEMAGLSAAATASAAPELSWRSIDAGGGTVASGDLRGTLTFGQPDAGAASGGTYHLTGGFLAARPSLPFFSDGFESGNTGAWSASFGDSDEVWPVERHQAGNE